MIPDPGDFTGSRKTRARLARMACEGIALLVQREAVYTMGAHPHVDALNVVWRRQVASMSAEDCLRFLAMIERDWPARKIRP
jgi:hypothetical protein